MSSYKGKKGYKMPVYVIVDENLDIDDLSNTFEDAVFSALYDYGIYASGFDYPEECTDYLEDDIDYIMD